MTMAANAPSSPAAPPLSYRIETVVIRMTLPPERQADTPQQLHLSGTGSATLERQGQRQPFSHTPQAQVAVLDALYRLQFFSLPTHASTRFSVVLRDDGTVLTQAMRQTDAPTGRVCVSIAAYEKCVTFSTTEPSALGQLVERTFADAQQRAVKP